MQAVKLTLYRSIGTNPYDQNDDFIPGVISVPPSAGEVAIKTVPMTKYRERTIL